ncbi:hypothetical protein GCM10008018_59520 [Paenibacillus marchantiophytorum]|uniref:Uncharacterized protein n=1 Tax=Paenibacillus marchantiophytorum TaxID=1619310 RepID=A0ABQ1FD54_9BACL|nr:hypothetical protein GCM10008018_59520 [Paenibacillus marchantiophytorum]
MASNELYDAYRRENSYFEDFNELDWRYRAHDRWNGSHFVEIANLGFLRFSEGAILIE